MHIFVYVSRKKAQPCINEWPKYEIEIEMYSIWAVSINYVRVWFFLLEFMNFVLYFMQKILINIFLISFSLRVFVKCHSICRYFSLFLFIAALEIVMFDFD